jgi:quercetin dioxygenase-like cupin family protein
MNTLEKFEALNFQHAILAIEERMKTMPPLEFKVVHHFANGIYARELHIPAGSALTGKIHKTEHLCTVAKGDIKVMDHKGYKHLKAGDTFVSKPGVKRLGLAIEDTIFVTYHPATTQNVDELLSLLVCDTFEEYHRHYVENVSREQDRLDYQAFLTEWHFTEEQVQDMVQNTDDLIDLPDFYAHLSLKDSAIAGQGLFSDIDIPVDKVIAPARVAGKRTPAGRYVNHSAVPNCIMWADKSADIWLISLYNILSGDELTVDYRQAGQVNIESLRLAA